VREANYRLISSAWPTQRRLFGAGRSVPARPAGRSLCGQHYRPTADTARDDAVTIPSRRSVR
jgi:hypothetical protein